MPTYIPRIPAAEVVRLLRAETLAAQGQPELNTCAWKDYLIQERADSDLVTDIATLSIEPRVERDYWVLRVAVERPMGPFAPSKENALARKDLTLDEFDAEMALIGRKRVSVRLDAETPAAKENFDRWLASIRTRYPIASRGAKRRKSKPTGVSLGPAPQALF